MIIFRLLCIFSVFYKYIMLQDEYFAIVYIKL